MAVRSIPVAPDAVLAGSLADLQESGHLLTKVGALPVVVFWHGDRAWAIEDRCPHLGFPLHRGTVEAGLVTCHWHHARFDLESGCTLDLWADDAHGFDVEVGDDQVWVAARHVDETHHHLRRLHDGLEEGLTLVMAKAVLALLDGGTPPAAIVRAGLDFGTTYRAEGWGSGLTVLVAMANVLDDLEPEDRAAALVHGLRFVSRDTGGHAPRFPVAPLDTDAIPPERLAGWYRRFVDTRSSDAAERVLQTALRATVGSGELGEVERLMMATVTDHVFIDGGHMMDFTNKAFEAVSLGADPMAVLPTLVRGTAGAHRSEESGAWRHPHDLPALLADAGERLADACAEGSGVGVARGPGLSEDEVAALGWALLADEPGPVVDAVVDALRRGATAEQVGRAVALAAGLRLVRFHVQNDHGDWDSVHHAFTAANALHHSLQRAPSTDSLRGALQTALRVYLDRFLNVPPARLPTAEAGDLDALARCWDVQGEVDTAGNQAWGFLRSGGSRDELIACLGRALLAEDAEFHWYQLYEAAVRQAKAWPAGSDESALLLVGFARFLAAHTPTRREVPTVIRTASRLRRGETLFESDD